MWILIARGEVISVSGVDVHVFDTLTGLIDPLHLQGHNGTVRDVRYNVDGTRIMSCSDSRTVRIVDAIDGKEVATLAEHTGRVNSVA